jgi:hypothetical protein
MQLQVLQQLLHVKVLHVTTSRNRTFSHGDRSTASLLSKP